MTRRGEDRPVTPPERCYTVTVQLTAREIAALVGQCGSDERPVAFCVTSADDKHHRVNFAESALKKVLCAVEQQRP